MSREGTAPFKVGEEIHQTWFKIFGEGQSATPLIVVHGGPGLSHDYLIPLADLARSRPVIFYDQIGNGRSTHLRDRTEKGFFTVNLFLDELANLLAYLKVDNAFDLYGHSWGGLVVTEFVIKRRPQGLKHLVLAGTYTDITLFNQARATFIKALPQDVQDTLARHRRSAQDITNPEFAKAMMALWERHGVTVKPMPKEFIYSINQTHSDPTVASVMFTHEIGNWKVEPEALKTIDVPTLLINGVDDIAQDFVVSGFFRHIPRIKWLKFPKSSHCPHWEEREFHMNEVEAFLEQV